MLWGLKLIWFQPLILEPWNRSVRWARHWRWSHAPFPYSFPTFGRDLDHNALRITELASGGRDDGHWTYRMLMTFNNFNRIQGMWTLHIFRNWLLQSKLWPTKKAKNAKGGIQFTLDLTDTFGIAMCVASGTLPRQACAPGGFQGHGGSGWELRLWCGQHGGTLTEICSVGIFTFSRKI